MALLDTEGFSFSTTAADYLTYGLFSGPFSPNVATTGGPFGDNYLNGVNSLSRALPGTPTIFQIGFRANLALGGGGGGASLVFVDTGSNPNMYFTFNADGSITLANDNYGSSQTVYGSTPAGLLSSGWHYVELGINWTTNVVTVCIDGVVRFTSNTIHLTYAVVANTASVMFGHGNAFKVAIAHYYMTDTTGSTPWNNFLGDTRVTPLNPTSNAAVAFAPNGMGSNYQNVNQNPPVPATDFNSSSTVAAEDTFNCGSLPSGYPTVYGINVKLLAQKNSAGARTVAPVIVSGTATGTGAATGLGTSPGLLSSVFQTDPATSAQWTVSAVNAARPGYTIVS